MAGEGLSVAAASGGVRRCLRGRGWLAAGALAGAFAPGWTRGGAVGVGEAGGGVRGISGRGEITGLAGQ